MLIVGLTGGIGSGKTVAANYFASLDVPVIDTDIIARQLVTPGSPALQQIATCFGTDILLPTGELDRPQLRQRMVNSANDRKQLESILHPLINEQVTNQLEQIDACYCIVVIPLLAESARYDFLDRVLVIDCPVELQVQRSCERDGMEPEFASRLVAIQASREQRLALANDVIHNDRDLDALAAQIHSLHDNYMNLCNKTS